MYCIVYVLYIICVLKLYKIDPIIIFFIEVNIPLWQTKLSLHHAGGIITTPEIYICSDIFQGDSFSPLIFCVGLFPLSRILNQAKVGFQLKKFKISHLLYIDDLKVYAKNEEELERIMKIVGQFSDNINMTFGLNKCTILYIKNGVYSTTKILPEIPKLDDDTNRGYQYLGIIEGTDFLHIEGKSNTQKECVSRVQKVLNSHIPGDTMMTAICAFAMPVL
eukprot:15232549-Ditylum_brightwellii.AAC.1